jgi:diguanylate cyclase (GGDEF)-like protein
MSVWHFMVAIAILPCLGVSAFAAVIATNRVSLAEDARRIERSVASIQRLNDLRVTVEDEVTAVAVESTLVAVGITADQAKMLGGYIVTATPSEAAKRTDAALSAIRTDPHLIRSAEAIETAVAEARRAAAGSRTSTPGRAKEQAWNAIRDYQHVSQLVSAAQSDTTNMIMTGDSGTGSSAVLRAASELRVISDIVLLGSLRATDFSLAYLAPVEELSSVRRSLEEYDASYRVQTRYVTRNMSPGMARAWQEFNSGPAAQAFDRLVERSIAQSRAGNASAPPMTGLFAVSQTIRAYIVGLSDLLEVAVTAGTSAASADRSAATSRARDAVIASGVIFGTTIGALLVLGGLIRRRLRDVADAANRLSSGSLEPMPVRGPREIAIASTGLNDAVASLRQMATTAETLAAGNLDSPDLKRVAPGPLGAAVHASVALLADSIRERERLQQELSHQAAHDPLTGLPNRAEAERQLIAALGTAATPGSSRRVGLLFVDLDYFKQVNDAYGHPAGDHVLQVAAARMAAEVRDSDTVCRLGGDEFVVIVNPAESDQAVAAIGKRIVEAVSRPISFEGNDLRIGASIGIAISATGVGPHDGHDSSWTAEELLTRADHAVYRAKAAGRNGVAF